MALSVTFKKKWVVGELVMVTGRAILTYTRTGTIPTGLRTIHSAQLTPFGDAAHRSGTSATITAFSGGNLLVRGSTGSSLTFTAIGYGL